MSDIAPAYLPCRAGIGQLSIHTGHFPAKERAMSTHEHPIGMPVRSVGASSIRLTSAKAFAVETIQASTETARAVLFAYAMSGSAVASLAIIAAPHLEVLLRCLFHSRG
jgi:hypothetical protein